MTRFARAGLCGLVDNKSLNFVSPGLVSRPRKTFIPGPFDTDF